MYQLSGFIIMMISDNLYHGVSPRSKKYVEVVVVLVVVLLFYDRLVISRHY